MKQLNFFFLVFFSSSLFAQQGFIKEQVKDNTTVVKNFRSFAFDEQVQLKTIAPKDVAELQALKVKWQQNLEKASGSKFFCSLPPANCIQSFQKIAFVDWKNKKIAKDKKYFISASVRSPEERRDVIYLPPSVTPEDLKKFYNISPTENCIDRACGESLVLAEKLRLKEIRDWEAISKFISVPKGKIAQETLCPQQADFYSNLFSGNEFSTTIAFGYEDEEDASHHYTKVDFSSAKYSYDKQVQELIKMGFKATQKDKYASTLEREFLYNDERVKAKVKLIMSTAPCPNEKGASATRKTESEICEEQKVASQKAKEAYIEALKNDQLVIYSGHSRYGRGPDFGPAFSQEGKVPIRAGALENIKMKDQAKILYLNSCSSKEHFSQAVKTKAATCSRPLELIANDIESYFSSTVGTNTAVIMSLIEGACPDDIATIVDANKAKGDESRTSVKGY